MKQKPPNLPDLPEKKYFRIGEVCKFSGLPAHTLRYWESEFPLLKPKKTTTGQRIYQRQDLEIIFWIKHLLYEQKYTIDGARKKLNELFRGAGEKDSQLSFGFEEARLRSKLDKAIRELKEIEKILSSPSE